MYRLVQFTRELTEQYEVYQYYKGMVDKVQFETNFKVHYLITTFTYEISAFYLDIVKDTLYADALNHPRRRACQTVLYHVSVEIVFKDLLS